MKNLQGSYWHLFHWWGHGIVVPMLPLITIHVFWWLVLMSICSIWRNICIHTQYPPVFHIWEWTVLRYHDFKVKHPYPFWGIKFMTILLYKSTIKNCQIVTPFYLFMINCHLLFYKIFCEKYLSLKTTRVLLYIIWRNELLSVTLNLG